MQSFTLGYKQKINFITLLADRQNLKPCVKHVNGQMVRQPSLLLLLRIIVDNAVNAKAFKIKIF